MIMMLIIRGININLADGQNRTAIEYCIELREEDLAILLIDRGCDIFVKNENRQTLIHQLAITGCHKVLRKLIEKGIDLNKRAGDGDTALLFALRLGSPDSLSIAQALIDANADVSIPDQKGLKPIELAKKLGYIGIETSLRYRAEVILSLSFVLLTFNYMFDR